jgi:hypothetical protein
MKAKGKSKPFIVFWLAILLISLFAGAAPAQEIFQFQAHNTKLEILPQAAFSARFGDNPDVPRTDADVIALARKLYPPRGVKQPEAAAQPVHRCREYEVGVLFAALQNPAISNLTRSQVDAIIQATIPLLPQTYTSGHFTFYYTDSDTDPQNNVTLAQIQATAAHLNSYWDKYAANFKTPKNYDSGGTAMVDVNVYYLGDGLYGETSSFWDNINLSSKLAVKNACMRRTTSAHELFHRVQYSYGYISGTARMRWMVEGTASWSQKYTNQSLRDYMANMNEGLSAPDRNLFNARDYDACHFWVYLQKLAGTWAAIKEIWAAYELNGFNAKAAVNTVTTSRLGKSFDQFVQAWVKANYLKDLDNAGSFEYDEDEVLKLSCNKLYGPLSHVPRTTAPAISNDTYWSANGRVLPYGADYLDLPLSSGLDKLEVKVVGAAPGNYSYSFIGIKGNRWKAITNIKSTSQSNSYTYKRLLTPGEWDKLALVVAGGSRGGDYAVAVGPDCITGSWANFDSYTYPIELVRDGTSVTGSHYSQSCGLYNITGTYTAPDLTLFLKPQKTCCDVMYTGSINIHCDSVVGELTRSGAPAGCTGTAFWWMHKIKN